MNYLLIHEDGFIEQRDDIEPQDYLDSIDAGILEIIRITNASFERFDGEWNKI